jgi:hypothetical protein
MGVFDYVPEQVTFLRKMVTLTTGKVIVAFPSHSLLREPARRLRYKLAGKGDIYLYSQDDAWNASPRRRACETKRLSASTLPVAFSCWSADARPIHEPEPDRGSYYLLQLARGLRSSIRVSAAS